MPVKVRTARREDAYDIHKMIVELAEFERHADQVQLTEEALADQLTAKSPPFHCIVSENEESGLIGFALFYYTYSTWTGKRGLHLEDLYVRPAYRSKQIGRKMLQTLVEIAYAQNLGRVEWMVLRWNERAQNFYSSLGAKPVDEFIRWRLDQQSIDNLARPAPVCNISLANSACVSPV
jgi:GNAT superfamily N-acetyltransferase